MFIIDYIKSITKRFGKNQVQKKCLETEKTIRAHTIPAYTIAVEGFKSYKFKSNEVNGFSNTFKKFVKNGKKDNLVENILETLKNSNVILNEVIKKADTLFQDQESTVGMTFEKATYLKLVGAIVFTNDFSIKLLNYIYILETAEASESSKIEYSIAPKEIQSIKENFLNFCNCCTILNESFDEILKKINTLPDAIVSLETEKTLAATQGIKRIDPLGFRNFTIPIYVSVKWNPIYWVGVVLADINVASYNAAKEDLELITLRKYNLEKIVANTPDASLQRQIEYLEERVMKLNYEIEKIEAKYA